MPKPFKGTIDLDVRDSTPDRELFLPPRAPDGSPNVLIVLLDDTGLAAREPFGGCIEMPTPNSGATMIDAETSLRVLRIAGAVE